MSVVHSATQRALRSRDVPVAGDQEQMNTAPTSGRKVTSEKR